MSRKRSWSLSSLPYPMRRVTHDGHRVDGDIGPPKKVTYSPFEGLILQLMIDEFQIRGGLNEFHNHNQ